MTEKVAEGTEQTSFRLKVSTWTPGEEAAWMVGKALDFFPGFEDFDAFRRKVGPFWVTTHAGNGLYECLERLHMAEVLERRLRSGCDYEFRWRPKG